MGQRGRAMQQHHSKNKLKYIILLIIFIILLCIIGDNQNKIEKLSFTVQDQKTVIEQMQYEQEQMAQALYESLVICGGY